MEEMYKLLLLVWRNVSVSLFLHTCCCGRYVSLLCVQIYIPYSVYKTMIIKRETTNSLNK